MVPSGSHPAWAKLVKGDIDHQFKPASAGMLFFSLRRKYKQDPSALSSCVQEARAFFEKYERILADDMKRIFG